jgi:hypothetical protein
MRKQCWGTALLAACAALGVPSWGVFLTREARLANGTMVYDAEILFGA